MVPSLGERDGAANAVPTVDEAAYKFEGVTTGQLRRFRLRALAAPALLICSRSITGGLIDRLPADWACVRYKVIENGKAAMVFPGNATVPEAVKATIPETVEVKECSPL